MNKYYYDLHIHSCLSPCGDDDNTPNNIIGMSMLSGLNIVALTDHNTAKNCPAFFQAAKKQGLIAVAGMELTTSEDIHAVCLFDTLEGAMEFDREVDKKRIKLKNKIEVFGRQQIMDGDDNVIGEEEHFLPIATTVSLEDVPHMVRAFNGVCYPAHIDRQSNGMIHVLGTFPETPYFSCFELRDGSLLNDYVKRYSLENKRCVVGSDAHCLTDIRDKEAFVMLDDEPYSSALVRKRLIEWLKEG
ncbi:MAG: PHP domain-containing protein [Clostridia bacterium]|jgi:hypothetical protein|nr:PHP domain-containing protein [Clostridia bacterium]